MREKYAATYGKIISEDGQMIGWRSVDGNVFDSGHLGYRGIIYFNSTMDEKFSSLNNTIGVFRSDSGTNKSIWLFE